MDIKTATNIITLSTVVLLFFGTRLVDDVLLFFLVGAIPGTDHSIPSWLMLAWILLAAGWLGYLVARAHGIDRAVLTLLQTARQSLNHRNFSDTI